MLRNVFFALGTIVILALAIIFLPIDRINWGRVSVLPAATVTVTGQANSDVSNQNASFNASVSSTNADKQAAVDDVNTKMTILLTAIKNFGISDNDIKTGSISVYQNPGIVPLVQGGSGAQTQIYPGPPVKVGNGGWTATNSVEIILRDISKASGLADILQSDATSVYGPNFNVSNSTQTDADLLAKAIADARQKAESIAKSGGQTIGKMINVVEGGNNYPIPLYAGAKSAGTGVPTPVQPGTTTLTKTVTVIFELK